MIFVRASASSFFVERRTASGTTMEYEFQSCFEAVRRSTKKEEADALTNIIQLVRFAYRQVEKLESAVSSAGRYFNLWVGHYQRNYNLTEKQRDIMAMIANYIACNGACTVKDVREDDQDRGIQLIRAFGNMAKANEALQSVFNFVVYRKTA